MQFKLKQVQNCFTELLLSTMTVTYIRPALLLRTRNSENRPKASISRDQRIFKAGNTPEAKGLVKAHSDELHTLCHFSLGALLIFSASWETRYRWAGDKHRARRAAGNPTGLRIEKWVSQDSQDLTCQSPERWEVWRNELDTLPWLCQGGICLFLIVQRENEELSLKWMESYSEQWPSPRNIRARQEGGPWYTHQTLVKNPAGYILWAGANKVLKISLEKALSLTE